MSTKVYNPNPRERERDQINREQQQQQQNIGVCVGCVITKLCDNLINYKIKTCIVFVCIKSRQLFRNPVRSTVY